ncbi:carbohydrate-binding protein [Natrialba asiatica]|uniref:PKD domain-containing protein n=1 Tax=Natrialba asiatica (strain ATCC 700177 / DSM 12278 / JCM 9576 / FERM P-10747 / NBRC 102637 / 172P1) TaxID=29540 RepID=M0B7D9_NATA1|nr:G8 domain-containing protein [Natrialba asiatica]ELZ05534.1 PKD domain-containing protein [Natrialba asiatica DSM 12278]
MTDNDCGTDEQYRPPSSGADTTGVDRRNFLEAVGIGTAGLVATGSMAGTTVAASSDGSPVLDLVDGDSTIEQPTHTAVGDGRWNDATTWDDGVPDTDARVTIPAGVTVTLGGETARLHWLRVDGTYRVDPTTDTHLRVDTIISTAGSTVEIGTAADPVAPAVTAAVTFLDRGPIDEEWDPDRLSRGVLVGGGLELVGASKTAHTTLDAHPRAGDSHLELETLPTNWRPGDTLVVPGVSARENQDEEVTIASVDGSTVVLEAPLSDDHVPPVGYDLNSYVLHLDRSVRFRSENTEIKRRGHVMILAAGSTIDHAGFYDLGRTNKMRRFSNPQYGGSELELDPNENVKSRYALHFHKTGPDYDLDPHDVTGCVVAPRTDGDGWKGSPGWGFTNHQSYAAVEDCISYKVSGTGFMTETGVEIGHFRNNFALRSEGSGRDPDWREFIENFNHERNIDDYGHGGHGFWLHGPLVSVENNVAAGHRNFAFAYWTRALGDYVPEALPYDDPRTRNAPTDELTEADIGRHRGTIPNVPADYADDKPTDERNVAPGTDGPNVAEFAHATYEADDGTVYVDEGSIPFRNLDNVAFASGSGIDVMNVMRGARAEVIEGNAEYYARIENFTGWNLRGRDGEDELPHATVEGFGGIRGVDLGIALRYSGYATIRNSRLIGDGRGVGISHNMRMDSLVVEDTTIERFEDGIGALNPGTTTVTTSDFDNANADVYISGEKIFGGDVTVELRDIDVDETVQLDSGDGSGMDQELTMGGNDVYYEATAPPEAEEDPRLVDGLIVEGTDDEDDLATTIDAVAYDDSAGDYGIEDNGEGGESIGWIDDNNWWAYESVVDTEGTVDVVANVSSPESDSAFHLEIDGRNVSGTVDVPSTGGWHDWTDVTVATGVAIDTQSTVRIVAETGSWNFNAITLQ